MKFFPIFFLLLTLALQGEEKITPGPVVYPSEAGSYCVGDWTYTYLVVSPKTRSQGCWGYLYYQGKELSAPSNTVVKTPVGDFLFCGGLQTKGWGEHGWLNTHRDYSGQAFPVFQSNGKIHSLRSEPVSSMSTQDLLKWNKAQTEAVNPMGNNRRIRVDAHAKVHILDGNESGGGHRPGTGIPGKSEFPKGMSDADILDLIESVANDPSSGRRIQSNGRTKVTGSRNGLDVTVITEEYKGIERVVTAFPTNVPRNP